MSVCNASHIYHTSDSIGVIMSQGGHLKHDDDGGDEAGDGVEPCLVEMSEVEYTQLQHLMQVQMGTQGATSDGPDDKSQPAAVMAISPVTTTIANQAIDLSTSTEEHWVMIAGEKTPLSNSEVPGYVMARIRNKNSPIESHASGSMSSQKRSRPAARVCLEKRFNTVDVPRQQDIQSAVLNSFLTILQQSAEAQEAATHLQVQKRMKADRSDFHEVSAPFVEDVFNAVSKMREQAIGHIPNMVDPKHQALILPKSLSINLCPERVFTKTYLTSGCVSTEEQQLVNIESDVAPPAAGSDKQHEDAHCAQPLKKAKAAVDVAGKSESGSKKKPRSHILLSQRRERHNNKERERRKRIRSCCDELNTLVPFCGSDSDKVTTLQWTTAFLRHISKMYGDTLKEEFKSAFIEENGYCPTSKSSVGQGPIDGEMDEALSIPHESEQ